MIKFRSIIQLLTISYLFEGYIRSFNPLLNSKKKGEYKIIFPLIPKFSNDGEIFWLKRCVRYDYYAIELGFRIYQYESLEKYHIG